MRAIDHHIHMYSRTTDDYERMAAAGIVAIMEPAFWLGSARRYPGTFWDYFNHLTTWEGQRAAKVGIDYYCAIAVNPKESEDARLAEETLAGMGEYLDRPNVVALGEIGFNNITPNEEKAFRAQLQIAVERNMPIMIHTPHVDKLRGTKRTVDILREMKVPPHLVDIDHNTEETMPVSRGFEGCWCGMTVYPTKLSPERTAKILKQWGSRRMLVNSSADWGPSDPLSLLRAAEAVRKLGLGEEVVRAITFDNPAGWMGMSPNFKFRVPATEAESTVT
ncbi:MAG: hypothetical protein BIFFINMI_00207 [Phycisphaerae bacterium]|nr:hypothetical protein [Phycisphaerae bacterium]